MSSISFGSRKWNKRERRIQMLEPWLTWRIPREEYEAKESSELEQILLAQGFNLYKPVLEDLDPEEDVVVFLQKGAIH